METVMEQVMTNRTNYFCVFFWLPHHFEMLKYC